MKCKFSFWTDCSVLSYIHTSDANTYVCVWCLWYVYVYVYVSICQLFQAAQSSIFIILHRLHTFWIITPVKNIFFKFGKKQSKDRKFVCTSD